jgi:hypothetical protein
MMTAMAELGLKGMAGAFDEAVTLSLLALVWSRQPFTRRYRHWTTAAEASRRAAVRLTAFVLLRKKLTFLKTSGIVSSSWKVVEKLLTGAITGFDNLKNGQPEHIMLKDSFLDFSTTCWRSTRFLLSCINPFIKHSRQAVNIKNGLYILVVVKT